MNLNYLHAEDFTFEPPMQRQNNDPFTCQDINDTTTEPAMAHVIKIGKIHANCWIWSSKY
jgi:hypothetical protein